MDILGLLEGFMTWQTPISFMAGVGVHHVYAKYVRDRRKDDEVITKTEDGDFRLSARFWVIAAIAAVIVGWIGVRTQQTADRVEEQAQTTAQCLSEVLTALQVARQVSGENDELSEQQRDATGTIILAVLDPPDHLKPLPFHSPQRQAFVESVAREELQRFRQAAQRQDEVQAYREQHPYPDPSCPLINERNRP